MVIHVVEPGDTLQSVAGRYGVSVAWLARYNGLDPNRPPVPGQTLVVLFPAQTHTVAAGDTLFSLAAAYGVSVNRLWRNNPQLNGRESLTVGEQLVMDFTDKPSFEGYINGYAYPFIEPSLLRGVLPFLSGLSVFSYGFTDSGELVVPQEAALLAAAAVTGTQPILVLTTLSPDGTFRSDLAARLLRDLPFQQTVIDAVVAAVGDKGYAGVDVDFEFVPASEAAAFAEFVSRLAARTREIGAFTAVALAPKTAVDQPGLLYEAHDYAALGAAADFVLLMTYEWGYTYGPPMAVAPLNQVRRVVAFGVSQIPPQKIFMGIPNYGYDWPLPYERGVTQARSIGNEEAVALARQYRADILFDETAQTPYFYYTDEGGVAHAVWFEDARSITAKLALIPEFGLRGASYWTVMRPFVQNWSILNAECAIQN